MSYRVHDYHKMRNHKSTEQSVVEGFFKVLWAIISFPVKLVFGRKRAKTGGEYRHSENVDAGFVRDKWNEIQQLMHLGNPSNYARAVMEADKLLDHIFKGLRTPGLTMGDRLRAAHNRFSKVGYNAAWQAHKVRNELVHNSEFQLMDYSARSAITNFEKAIRELINF